MLFNLSWYLYFKTELWLSETYSWMYGTFSRIEIYLFSTTSGKLKLQTNHWLRIILGKDAYTDVLALCLGKDKSVKIVNSTLHFFGFSIIFFFNNCIGETMWAFHSSPYPFCLWCPRVSDHLNASHVRGAESESGALWPHLQRRTRHRPLSLNPFLSNGFRAAEWILFRSAWESPSLSGEACSWAEYKSCYLSVHDTRFC